MHDKSFSGKRFGFFSFDNGSIVYDSSPKDRKHNNVHCKWSVPTAATDNDIISSFPGWTRLVSVGGLVHVDCSTLTLKGCYVFWYPPNYFRTSFDSDRRHGALTHRLILVSLRFTLTVPSLWNVRSYPHEGMSAGVCPIEQLRL